MGATFLTTLGILIIWIIYIVILIVLFKVDQTNKLFIPSWVYPLYAFLAMVLGAVLSAVILSINLVSFSAYDNSSGSDHTKKVKGEYEEPIDFVKIKQDFIDHIIKEVEKTNTGEAITELTQRLAMRQTTLPILKKFNNEYNTLFYLYVLYKTNPIEKNNDEIDNNLNFDNIDPEIIMLYKCKLMIKYSLYYNSTNGNISLNEMGISAFKQLFNNSF